MGTRLRSLFLLLVAVPIAVPASAELVSISGGLVLDHISNFGVFGFHPPPLLDMPGVEWFPPACNIPVWFPDDIDVMNGIDRTGTWTADLWLVNVTDDFYVTVYGFEHGTFELDWTWVTQQVWNGHTWEEWGRWEGRMLMIPDPDFVNIDGLGRGTFAGPFEFDIWVDEDIFRAQGNTEAQLDIRPLVVPEPATLLLVSLGLAAAWRSRRSRE
jgi:hypothetical protein